MGGCVRTPNTECLLCGKPLYRRPGEMFRTRYAACMEHRSEAQKAMGITDKQHDGLRLGRVKGDNHRTGYRHTKSSKRKASAANKKFWKDNPDKALARGAKTRGDKHPSWKGGVSKFNTSIRQMTENRAWMDAVKARDGACARCGSAEDLEAHHKVHLADLIEKHEIKSREGARVKAAILWDLDNGETLCRRCHYVEHGRTFDAN